MNAIEAFALATWVAALGMGVSCVVTLRRLIRRLDEMIARHNDV
jgi:hypothetical protein